MESDPPVWSVSSWFVEDHKSLQKAKWGLFISCCCFCMYYFSVASPLSLHILSRVTGCSTMLPCTEGSWPALEAIPGHQLQDSAPRFIPGQGFPSILRPRLSNLVRILTRWAARHPTAELSCGNSVMDSPSGTCWALPQPHHSIYSPHCSSCSAHIIFVAISCSICYSRSISSVFKQFNSVNKSQRFEY